jgi:ribosomal protein S18 acetylase RimI-like enzyme
MMKPGLRSILPFGLGEGPITVDLADEPSAADILTLERGLFAFEEARLGDPEHGHYTIFLRDRGGQIRGGADCHALWHRLFLKTLWVAEELRGQGFGTKLMESVEREAAKRACRSVWLTALGDRACHFYDRLGYRVFGIHPDYVQGQALYSLRKDVVDPH